MKQLLPLLTLLLLLTAFTAKEEFFSGKIIYQYHFTDFDGNDINAHVVPIIGSESHYYINSKHYKSQTNDKLQQLYHAETNTYYSVLNDTITSVDGKQKTTKKYKLKHLPGTVQVAGFDCKVLQVETDNSVTDYYYSPQLRVDRKAFAKHNYGEWNKYLKATDGALALKHVLRDKRSGLVWTATASEIIPMELSAADFALPATLPVKE